MTKNILTSGEGYERDITHYEFDISPHKWSYSLGDVLAVYPHNNPNMVDQFLDEAKLNPEECLDI